MIRELQKGDRLTADYLRDLVCEVRRGRVAAGHGLLLTVTPTGSVISLAPHCSSPRSASGMIPQWQINLTVDSGGAPLLRVHRGIAHWGGQHWAVWPGGGHDVADAYQDLSLADLADGAVMLVLWHTSDPPCPLYHCPLQPAGPEIDFKLSGTDCSCTLSGYPKPGSPEDYSPGPGAVSLHAPASIEADAADWTDCVALGAIAREGDQYTITQLHDATITVRILRAGGPLTVRGAAAADALAAPPVSGVTAVLEQLFGTSNVLALAIATEAASRAGDRLSISNALAAAVQAEALARAAGDSVALTNWQARVDGLTNGAALGATALQPSATNTLAAAAAHAATEHGVTGDGGFRGGISAVEMGGGAAIGNSARSYDGGGAVGSAAICESGGGAAGIGTKTSSGFAGGMNAVATTDGTYDGEGIDAIQLGTGGNKEPGTLQIYSNRLLNADGTIPVERLTLHDTNTLAHADIRGEIATATNELVQTYLLGTNAWMSISNAVLTIWRETNGVPSALWSSAESEGGGGVDPAFTNAVWAALAAKGDAAWGTRAPDGSANPDPAYMTFLNAPATMHASGYQWATYGAYSVMAESGAVAFESGSDGEARWGLDLHTNYVGFVSLGSFIVAAKAGAITVAGGGTTNGLAEIVYPYTSGDFPALWYAPALDIPFAAQTGVVWADNQDGTATVTAPATTPKGFWYATTASVYDTIFDIRPPARLTGGVIGSTNVTPVVYDSTIEIRSGGKTYRIPAQAVP